MGWAIIMPNATFDDDVDLHRIARLAKAGWTFRVNRAGIWIRAPLISAGYYGDKTVSVEMVQELEEQQKRRAARERERVLPAMQEWAAREQVSP
jgi:succinylglutamate desuccinylase